MQVICVSPARILFILGARSGAPHNDLLHLHVVLAGVVHDFLGVFPFRLFSLLSVGLYLFLLLRHPFVQHKLLLLKSTRTELLLVKFDLKLLLLGPSLVLNCFDPQFLQLWQIDVVLRLQVANFKLFLKSVSVKNRCGPCASRFLL